MSPTRSRTTRGALAGILLLAAAGCASRQEPRTTARDKTGLGAGIGAAAGAVVGAVAGEGEADEILAGAAIGAGLGAAVGAYMDHQEEKLARIPGTRVERVAEDMLLVHFESDVLFDVDSATLAGDSKAVLDEAAGVFLEYPKTAIVVQGHTDSSGSETHNEELSQRRARMVEGYVIGRGVDAERISAIGHGEGQPVASNESEEGRRRNRRVDLLLKAKVR